jgi:hypothetical protein
MVMVNLEFETTRKPTNGTTVVLLSQEFIILVHR